MSLRIGFFQYERSHPGNPPHVGMCLLLADARAAGHDVDAMLVPPGALPQLISHAGTRAYDLIAVDGIFGREPILALKAAHPELPILAGGANALGLILAAPVDYAIMGAGRVAMRGFLEAFEAGALPGEVPNLFHRTPGGALDHTGVLAGWDMGNELTPFTPDLEWSSFGPPRTRRVLESASVVPEWGCAFRDDALEGPVYAGRELPAHAGTLAETELTPRAGAAVAPYLANTRGCAFCTFRLQPYAVDAVAATVARTLEQVRYLNVRYGLTHVSVQSEHPFRFVLPLAEAIVAAGIPVRTLSLRTFPRAIASSAERVLASIDALVRLGFRVRLQQLGFESFVQSELDRLGKGITVEENIRAARLLGEIHRRHGGAVEVFRGHGFILLTPWTKPEDVIENARVVRAEAPFLAAAIGLHSRLAFYEPMSPIVRLAAAEGLLVSSPRDYGLDYRFADPRTDRMCRLARAVEDVIAREGEPRSPRLARASLLAAAEAVVEGADAAPDVLFARAVQGARSRIAEDAREWAGLASVEPHRV